MDTIDNNVMQAAAEHVTRTVQRGVELHTVNIYLNGQHGGADLVMVGSTRSGLNDFTERHVIR